MPTNNILLFDQNKGNMLNDSAYSTNQQRLNGVQSGIASSQLQNKFQYQVSLVAYAIASIMYNNGMDANDADAVSAFVSNMSNTLVQKVLDKASTQEAQAGTVNTKWMSPALVKAAIDYCHANAITFGSNVNVGGNLLVSGTSKMNGAVTFASTSTFAGAATFNGVASGQSPTAASHLATKGYVDSGIANVKLKYINRFNLQINSEITILSQEEADKHTLYYFCAFFKDTGDNVKIYFKTTSGLGFLFSYPRRLTNIYNMSIMLNNVNGNSCSSFCSSDREIQTDGIAGKFTGIISNAYTASGSYVDVYAL